MEYQLHFNLQQNAAFRIAITLWEKKEVQNKLKQLFKSYKEFREAKYEWRKFTKTIVDKWEKGVLPQNLEIELIHVVKMIGEAIFNWHHYYKYEYVKHKFRKINDINIIHWTPYGIVNETKTVPFSLAKSNNNMTNEELKNNLRFRVMMGNFSQTKYFWEKLNDEDRRKSVLPYARLVVKIFYLLDHPSMLEEYMTIKNYKKSQYTGICVFLMSQMSKSDKESFFNTKTKSVQRYHSMENNDEELDVKGLVLKMLISSWPWQEFFIPVLKDMLQYYDDNNVLDCVFLDEITFKMVNDHRLGYSLKTSKYRSLFHEVWLTLPASIKQNVIKKITNFHFIDHLMFVNDIDSLKLILYDPVIATVRKQFMDFKSYYGQFTVAYRYKLLKWFINEIECM